MKSVEHSGQENNLLDNQFDAVVAPSFDKPLSVAHKIAADFLADLAIRPPGRAVTPGLLHAALGGPIPETGIAAEDAVSEWFTKADPGIFASAGPRFFGFVTGGSTPAALAGDWLASAIDQNAGLWLSSPAAAETELAVLDWLKQLFRIPNEFAGSITTGATMANLAGLAAARQWASARLGFDAARDGLGGRPPITVISTTEIHASARKALGTLGLGRNQVIEAPAPNGSADMTAFAATLAQIPGPVIIVGNAGEVNTGAFDPIDEMARLRDRHPGGAWLHVDGAFGLFASISPRFQHLTAEVERADSIAADAHKWLNVPYDAGFVFVRDREPLRAAFAARAAYLTPGPDAPWDPHSHAPEMSRRFRALSIWCALRADGRSGYQDLVERSIDHAANFARWVEREPGLELLAPAPLNIVCFRVFPSGSTATDEDRLNREVVAAIQAGGQAFVTGTVWKGQCAIRAAFDNWMTTATDVEILQAAVTDAVDQISR